MPTSPSASDRPSSLPPYERSDDATKKRKRASTACDSCRERRIRCQEGRPVCSACKKHGRLCEFSPPSKRSGGMHANITARGKRACKALLSTPGGRETLFSLLKDIGVNPDSQIEEVSMNQLSMNQRVGKSVLDRTRGDSFGSKEREEKNKDERTWIDTRTPCASLYGDGTTPCSAESAATQFHLNRTHSVPVTITQTHGTTEPLAMRASNALSSAQGSIPLHLPMYALQLLEAYLSFTHNWMPVVDRTDLFRTLDVYSHHLVDVKIHGAGSGSHAILWAAMALVSRQTPPSIGSLALTEIMSISNIAFQLVPEDLTVLETGHLQALIILSMLKFGSNSFRMASRLLKRAITAAFQFAPVLRPMRRQVSTTHFCEITRALIGCFILETLYSSRCDTYPTLRTIDLSKLGIKLEALIPEGAEEWSPWPRPPDIMFTIAKHGHQQGAARTMSTFVIIARLCAIINDWTCLRACKKLSPTLYFQQKDKLAKLGKSFPSDQPGMDGQLPHIKVLSIMEATVLSLFEQHLEEAGLLAEVEGRKDHNLATNILSRLQSYVRSFGITTAPPILQLSAYAALNRVRYFGETAIIDEKDQQAQMVEILLHEFATSTSMMYLRGVSFDSNLVHSRFVSHELKTVAEPKLKALCAYPSTPASICSQVSPLSLPGVSELTESSPASLIEEGRDVVAPKPEEVLPSNGQIETILSTYKEYSVEMEPVLQSQDPWYVALCRAIADKGGDTKLY